METIPKINRRYLRTSGMLSSDGRAARKWCSPALAGRAAGSSARCPQGKCPGLGMRGEDPGRGPSHGCLVTVVGGRPL